MCVVSVYVCVCVGPLSMCVSERERERESKRERQRGEEGEERAGEERGLTIRVFLRCHLFLCDACLSLCVFVCHFKFITISAPYMNIRTNCFLSHYH